MGGTLCHYTVRPCLVIGGLPLSLHRKTRPSYRRPPFVIVRKTTRFSYGRPPFVIVP